MVKEKQKRRRRVRTPELKADTVKLVQQGGRRVGQVAQELGLADSLVRSWMRQAEVDIGKGPADALTTAEKEELSHLRREVKVLRIEREIQKRAATFFANLTEAAHGRNIEAGVLLSDPVFARSLRMQFESLVDKGFVRRLTVG